jgi:hypothetical protein
MYWCYVEATATSTALTSERISSFHPCAEGYCFKQKWLTCIRHYTLVHLYKCADRPAKSKVTRTVGICLIEGHCPATRPPPSAISDPEYLVVGDGCVQPPASAAGFSGFRGYRGGKHLCSGIWPRMNSFSRDAPQSKSASMYA